MNLPENILDVFLQPGDFYWGDSETRIRTLLGSCVSFCLWHPYLKIGGMCHYMLPSRGVRRNLENRLDGRYADEAMEMFLIEIERANTKPQEYKVKLFGGASMFSDMNLRINKQSENTDFIRLQDMGTRNIEKARQLVETFRLNVTSENLGGTRHRRLHFDLWSGNVWLKRQETNE
ncbi:MAG: chemotaxis protein CheD [Leptospiraceae bacterium]|nr:chemotaxis protein CheD [Leptospiraceae bacterium]MCK6381419.1 chemotaxis protein CheD [Leptospiraceae bacterium]NUM41632.1 chemotaxis protein CheD [Leptospiraceae bacterium]